MVEEHQATDTAPRVVVVWRGEREMAPAVDDLQALTGLRQRLSALEVGLEALTESTVEQLQALSAGLKLVLRQQAEIVEQVVRLQERLEP